MNVKDRERQQEGSELKPIQNFFRNDRCPKITSENIKFSLTDAHEPTGGWMFAKNTARHRNQRKPHANQKPETQNTALYSNHDEARAQLKIP
jgi:hypothetical protein